MINIDNFERLKFDGHSYGFYKTFKLKNNQTASIFFLNEKLKRGTEYSVVFAIASKKKYIKQWILGERDVLTNEATGRCGMEGLIWAKKQIIEFEEYIKEKTYHGEITICIYWTDSRRRDIYQYALGKLGYTVSYRHFSKCLSKKVR